MPTEENGAQGLFESLKDSFETLLTIELETSEGIVPIISLNEMPITTMMNFMESPEPEKMSMMFAMMRASLTNPEDLDKLKNLSVREFAKLIEQWMQKSQAEDNDATDGL